MKYVNIVKLFFLICAVSRTEIGAFRCNSGKEISDIRFCNGQNDCDDNSDEGYGCTRRSCRRAKFTCQDGSCMDIKVRCNGILDCQDQSDEQNCAQQSRIQVQPQDCTLNQGKFLCKNELACLDFSYTCDGRCHCTDCSDESGENCDRLDSESCSSCTRSCLPTPDGPQCVCNSSAYESSPLCKEIQTCIQRLDCDQHCIRFRNFERCLCNDGYYEMPNTNGQKCLQKAWLKTILFYSTVTRIKSDDFANSRMEIIQNGVYCTALTGARGYLYYASLLNNKGRIYKTPIDGGISEKIVELDSRITSVSVDWVTENVYFTNSNSISVCSNNSQICVQLMCCGVNNVVLAPKFGWMFYSYTHMVDTLIDENDQFIMKSNMDGSNEEVLLPDESFLNPVSMTTDELTGILYWLEITEGKLHSISFDGSNRQIHYLGEEKFSYLAVLQNSFYFAKHRNNSFYNSLAALSPYAEHQDNSTSAIRHLYVYNPDLLQHTYQTKNPCEESSCTGICLIRSSPSYSSYAGLNVTCFCENFAPTDDNNWCNTDEKYSLQENEPSTTNSLIQTSTTHETDLTTEFIPTTSDLGSENKSTSGFSQTTPNAETSTTGYVETTTISGEGSSSKSTSHSSTGLPESVLTTSEKFNSPTTESNIKTTTQKTSSIPIAEGINYVLIYSTVTKIKAWFLANGTHQVIQNGVDSTALAGARDHIYHAIVKNDAGHVFRTSIESGQTDEVLKIDSQVTSIAVDWITNNVYFTADSSLSVCSNDGKICAELKCCDTDDVALSPNNQWMFYTSKMTSEDKRIIMKSSMDGSDEIILLDESFHEFISLTVDESSAKVYWLEIEEQILHSVSFFGSGREERLLKTENRAYKFFAVLEENLFFTFGRNGFEWRFPLWSHFWQDSSTNDVKFLHAFDPHSHYADSASNPCETSPCFGLCVLHSGSPGFTCLCENFTSTNENYWCNKKKSYSVANSNLLIQNNKEEVQSSATERYLDCDNGSISLRKAPTPANFSLATESASASGSPQIDYHLIASGVLGFILGISTATFGIVVCFVFQKCYRSRSFRRKMRIQDDMEM
ncbi:vitellogenin receptor-like [Planococcus citri]|uniref:vitellogenin receptor-like n=1 Tax=Planococcus citri TaxID=170843 RepID=UPI0031F83F3B